MKTLSKSSLASQSEQKIWVMRQAGRYLPEYREVRAKAGDFVSLCLNPEFASEVTLQPIRRFDFDAAIIFSDILMIPYALGQKLWFEEGEGPRLGDAEWSDFSAEKLAPVYEAIRLTRTGLNDQKSLIGFAGAPWTLLVYALQGKGGGEFEVARKAVYADQKDALNRIEILTNAVIDHLSNQIDAGCDAVQIFDSWAALCPADLQNDFIVQPARKIVSSIRAKHPDVTIIAFPKGFSDLEGFVETVKPDVLGCDQFTSRKRMKTLDCMVQGNLDPLVLIEGGVALEEAIKTLKSDMQGKKFIFNLGHGISKETPIGHVETLVRIVRS